MGELRKAIIAQHAPELKQIAQRLPSTIDGKSIKIVPMQGEDGNLHQIIDVQGRPVVLVEIDGKRIPFYVSTGSGGKKSVATGKWYPIFGVGSDGWFNKTSEADINNYYNSKTLKAVAHELDKAFGDLRRHPGLSLNDQFTNEAAAAMHRDIGVGFNNGMSAEQHQKYLNRIKNIIAMFGDDFVHQPTVHRYGGQIQSKYQHLRK